MRVIGLLNSGFADVSIGSVGGFSFLSQFLGMCANGSASGRIVWTASTTRLNGA